MTKAREELVGSLFNYLNVEIWYMLEANLPSAGTYNVSVTLGGSSTNVIIAATSVAGAKQQAPESTRSKDCSGASSCQRFIATLSDNAWIFDIMGVSSSTSLTPDISQTERWDRSLAAGSTKLQEVAGSTPMVWSFGGTMAQAAIAVVAFAPHISDTTLTGVGAISSGEAFGSHTIAAFSGELLFPNTIASEEAFGTATLASVIELSVGPIDSDERVPLPFVFSHLLPEPTPVSPSLIPE
jgi:hypothetical protein